MDGPNGQKDAFLVQKPISTTLNEQEWSLLDSYFSTRLLLNMSVNTASFNSPITTILSVGNFSVSLSKRNLVIDILGEKYTIPVNFAAGFQNIIIDLETDYMLIYLNCVKLNATLSNTITKLFEPGAVGNLTIADPSPLIVRILPVKCYDSI